MNHADAEDILGRAARIEQEASDTLTHEEVVAAAKDVGVSEASVKAAERERERIASDHRKTVARRRKITMIVGVVAIVSVVGIFLVNLSIHAEVSRQYELVQRRHADVRSAMQRRAVVIGYWQNRIPIWCSVNTIDPATASDCMQEIRNRDAELAGAENRVTVAIRRYDADVSRYNQSAETLSTGDLPRHVPYSSEVSQW